MTTRAPLPDRNCWGGLLLLDRKLLAGWGAQVGAHQYFNLPESGSGWQPMADRRRFSFKLKYPTIDETALEIPTPKVRPLVIYDSECGFCRWSAATIARLDRDATLAIAPANEVARDELPAGKSPLGQRGSIRLLTKERLLDGAGALIAIAAEIRCLAPMAMLVRGLGLEPILEMAYRGFAPRRGRAAGLISTDRITRR